MQSYQLEIKQIVDYPRCRIYRQFIQNLMADRSIRTSGGQCHLDKDDAKNSVCRNMYPVLFLYNFINHLTG